MKELLVVVVAIALCFVINAYAEETVVVTSDNDIIVCTTGANGVVVCL